MDAGIIGGSSASGLLLVASGNPAMALAMADSA